MIFITGDTHGDVTRLSKACFPEQYEMEKQLNRGEITQEDNFVIICGDFGLIWEKTETKQEKHWLDWLEDKSFTTLFIDGNHDNFDRLNAFPVEKWHGGKVHKIRPHVIHLMRGETYKIQGKTIFTFGGASSHDIKDGILEKDDPRINKWYKDGNKLFRINHVSWWKEELPSKEEMEEGLKNLEKTKNKVDFIITHSPTSSITKQLGWGLYETDVLTDYLQNIAEKVDYKKWFFGHMHVNQMFNPEKSIGIYEQIIRIA